MKVIYDKVERDIKNINNQLEYKDEIKEDWLDCFYKDGINGASADELFFACEPHIQSFAHEGSVFMVIAEPIGFSISGVFDRADMELAFDYYWGKDGKSGLVKDLEEYFESCGFYSAAIVWTGDNDGGTTQYYLTTDKSLAVKMRKLCDNKYIRFEDMLEYNEIEVD